MKRYHYLSFGSYTKKKFGLKKGRKESESQNKFIGK